MPAYVYRCNDCLETFEVRHSMSQQQNSCILCNGESVFKIPAIANTNISKSNKNESLRPGHLVDDYIKQTKQDVKKEKRRLKSEEM